MQFIDLKAQYAELQQDIQQRINTVLEHGQYILGPEVADLEQQLATYTGSAHCIGVSSGSDALLIAMMALGIGVGDEVITTPFTFFATAEMIVALGAVPVFVDIEPDNYNLNPTLIEAALSSRTKAIMPVNLFGQCARYDELTAFARNHGLAVIEDAAQSFGATYKGRRSGSLGTIAATSFFPAKPLGCYGDGGAVFTDDDELAARMRALHVHGQGQRYHHDYIGINGRLDTIQAAVLLAKLPSFPDEIAARQRIAARYSERLGQACPQLSLPHIEPENSSVYAQYTIESDHRDQLVAALAKQQIPTAVHYPVPLHQQIALESCARVPLGANLNVSERAAKRVLSLPMHPFLSTAEQDKVVDAVALATASL